MRIYQGTIDMASRPHLATHYNQSQFNVDLPDPYWSI